MKKSIVNADYQGMAVSFGEDGWFNATEAAKHFKKDAHEWLRLPSTVEYIETLCKIYSENSGTFKPGKIPGLKHTEITQDSSYKKRSSRFVKIRRGNQGGIWLHPKLAVSFARWCNVEFAIWCDMQIDQLLRKEHPHFDWKRGRHRAAVSFSIMMDMLKMTREYQGKETEPHHYINEARMLNGVLSGKYSHRDRESLPKEQLDLIADMEIKNTMLLALGLDYHSRKDSLSNYAADRALDFAEGMETPALAA